jgi:hypothetical protein
MKDQRWQDWLTSAVGLFVLFSPFIVPSFTGAAVGAPVAWAFWIIGGVMAIIGLSALANPHRWEEWAQLILGVSLMSSPFALGFHDQMVLAWMAILTGTIVAVLALWALASDTGNIPYQQ